jgi:hypothetical protein
MVSSESKYLEFSVSCSIQKQCFCLIENVEIQWNLIKHFTTKSELGMENPGSNPTANIPEWLFTV